MAHNQTPGSEFKNRKGKFAIELNTREMGQDNRHILVHKWLVYLLQIWIHKNLTVKTRFLWTFYIMSPWIQNGSYDTTKPITRILHVSILYQRRKRKQKVYEDTNKTMLLRDTLTVDIQKLAIFGNFGTSKLKMTQKRCSQVYKSMVFWIRLDKLYSFLKLLNE